MISIDDYVSKNINIKIHPKIISIISICLNVILYKTLEYHSESFLLLSVMIVFTRYICDILYKINNRSNNYCVLKRIADYTLWLVLINYMSSSNLKLQERNILIFTILFSIYINVKLPIDLLLKNTIVFHLIFSFLILKFKL